MVVVAGQFAEGIMPVAAAAAAGVNDSLPADFAAEAAAMKQPIPEAHLRRIQQ